MGFMVGTGYIMEDESGTSCGGGTLDLVLYLIVALHVVNIVIALVNLSGNEEKICFGGLICGISLFELGVLIFMQIGYFEAMEARCYMQQSATKYYWIAGQIMILYMSFVVVICHFFRKFCQDDPEDDEFQKNDTSNLA